MIIELCGLPASGKSTFAKRLEREYGCLLSSKRPLRKKYIIFGILNYFLMFFKLMYYAVTNGKRIGIWYRLKCFVLTRLGELYRAEKNRNHKCHVLDEGPLQALLAVSGCLEKKDILFFLKKTPADIIILFSPNERERNKKVLKRDYNLRPYLSDSERKDFEHNLIKKYSSLKKEILNDNRVYLIDSYDYNNFLIKKIIKNIKI